MRLTELLGSGCLCLLHLAQAPAEHAQADGARGSRQQAAADRRRAPELLAKHSADLFRERGTLALPAVHESVHAVVHAACAHVLQGVVDTVRAQALSLGAVHQAQVDMVALQGALALPVLLPFFQDVLAACEARCTAHNVVLLTAQQLGERQDAGN